ncbi:esterase [Anopheles sinensis]|uniref:Esterase n=1 Tax=Anopheles sinensis TaxID=74873 RepID=A0A084VEV0_ANOSI|nr:esterase [Anopheles sinensis]
MTTKNRRPQWCNGRAPRHRQRKEALSSSSDEQTDGIERTFAPSNLFRNEHWLHRSPCTIG